MIKNIATEAEFQTETDAAEGLMIVKFGAPWCAPCKVIDKTLEEVSAETGITVLKVNVDELPELAGQFRIMSVPTTYFIKNKEAVTILNGAGSKDTILGIITTEA
ncbi:thioredoxin family protein [Paenibacillus sp. FSL R7-0302]|uniref:thioredoxin family protein n=1 Tax=Paenibacillus sp. FSL R7-0302 TaxID=2921681 RepID=UPI0030F56788